MKIKLKRSVSLGLENRDGNLYACEDTNGIFYLVLEALTLHNNEVFEGLGSTEYKMISKEAFESLI